MKKVFLVAYDGTRFEGFIGSKNSVFEYLINAFRKVLNEDIEDISYSSRTDPGVSALKNVICFKTSKSINLGEVNSILPQYLKIWAIADVDDSFSARNAIERIYIYLKPYEGEDIELMREASKMFIGIHDFSNFMIMDEDSNPITQIYSIDVDIRDGFIIFRFSGKGFRNKMIRKIVWTLTMVGKRLLDIDYVRKLINVEIRRTVPSAPPEGLILVDVKYGVDIKFKIYERALYEFLNYLRERYLRMFSLTLSYSYMIGVVSSRLVMQYFLNKPL